MAENETAPPTFHHAVELYRLMFKKSQVVSPIDLIGFGYPVTENVQVRTYTGTLKMLGDKLGFSESQRSGASSTLNSMNCITMLKPPGGHGGRKGPVTKYSPGVWILHYEPTVENWTEFRETNLKILRRTMPSRYMQTIQQLSELAVKINQVEELFKKLEERVTALESRIGHDVRRSPPLS